MRVNETKNNKLNPRGGNEKKIKQKKARKETLTDDLPGVIFAAEYTDEICHGDAPRALNVEGLESSPNVVFADEHVPVDRRRKELLVGTCIACIHDRSVDRHQQTVNIEHVSLVTVFRLTPGRCKACMTLQYTGKKQDTRCVTGDGFGLTPGAYMTGRVMDRSTS